jgi:hypothetical protein
MMTAAEIREVMSKLDGAMSVFRRTSSQLTAGEIRTTRLLQLVHDQLQEDLTRATPMAPPDSEPLQGFM